MGDVALPKLTTSAPVISHGPSTKQSMDYVTLQAGLDIADIPEVQNINSFGYLTIIRLFRSSNKKVCNFKRDSDQHLK